MNNKNKKLKKFTKSVSEILYTYDPVGFVHHGVPYDEYDPEARAIIGRLKDVTDMQSLRWIVYDVFKNFFDKDMILASGDKCYRLIAEKIWDVWQDVIDN